jgi:hypothetical protein
MYDYYRVRAVIASSYSRLIAARRSIERAQTALFRAQCAVFETEKAIHRSDAVINLLHQGARLRESRLS